MALYFREPMKRVSSPYERTDARGLFREYISGSQGWKAINQGVMKKGAVMGNHYHKKCAAAFFLLSGSAEFLWKDVRKKAGIKKFRMKEGEGALIDPYETHTIKFLETSSFLVLKSRKFDPKDKDLYEARLL